MTITRTEPRADYLTGLQLRAKSGLQLDIVAVGYSRWYMLPGNIEETFEPGCFGDLRGRALPLLVAHEHASLPVGKSIGWTDSATSLRGRFQLADTARGCELHAQVADGFVTAVSIGFRSMPPSGSVVEARAAGGLRITRRRCELLEVSLVGVGAFPDARVTAVPVVEQPAPVLVGAKRSRPATPVGDAWSMYRPTLDIDCTPFVRRSIVDALRTGPVRGPWDTDRA